VWRRRTAHRCRHGSPAGGDGAALRLDDVAALADFIEREFLQPSAASRVEVLVGSRRLALDAEGQEILARVVRSLVGIPRACGTAPDRGQDPGVRGMTRAGASPHHPAAGPPGRGARRPPPPRGQRPPLPCHARRARRLTGWRRAWGRHCPVPSAGDRRDPGRRQSARMGVNKSLLRLGGQRFVERLLQTLRPLCGEVAVIANDPGSYQDLGVEVWPDHLPGKGPLGGIHTALSRSRFRTPSASPATCPWRAPG